MAHKHLICGLGFPHQMLTEQQKAVWLRETKYHAEQKSLHSVIHPRAQYNI